MSRTEGTSFEALGLEEELSYSSSAEFPMESVNPSRRMLKHSDAFIICNAHGDIWPGEANEEGYYFDGTRFISSFILKIDGKLPLLLGSHVKDQNDALVVTLTNTGRRATLQGNGIRISKRLFLLNNACYMRVECENFTGDTAEFELSMGFDADYADIYEIRGMARANHGTIQRPNVGSSHVELNYLGLDGEQRSTYIKFSPAPGAISASTATYSIKLEAREVITLNVRFTCNRSGRAKSRTLSRLEAEERWLGDQEHQLSDSATVHSSNGQFNEWFDRSLADLNMMTSELPTGSYPYAGIPWFNTPFGRDGIVTALECLWMKPSIARGVLSYLAETQATDVIPEEDAEPGKILHEIRKGEMAALKEMPFGRYYGSVDATPLFVMLAGAYYERTADLDFIRDLWPAVSAATAWMKDYGDIDGDGFIEYKRQALNGLIHQGWKDSDDAIFHADGSPAQGALAVCEVQGYAYGALRAGAVMAERLGHFADTADLTERAESLYENFNRSFWCEEIGTYGLALDGDKKLCAVKSSNAGQCLLSGIATPSRAQAVAGCLFAPDCYSGWGIRTLSSDAARFNPMSYHNGSVWPHDNGLIALGLARYGLTEHVCRLFEDMFASVTYFDRYRLPELFCGFDREKGIAPVLYPVACAPQSWSAASIFLLLQSCLGLQVDGISSQVSLTRPMLPKSLRYIHIGNLKVGDVTLNFEVSGRGRNTNVRTFGDLKGCSVLLH
jgi:glycogen debranching enzyme